MSEIHGTQKDEERFLCSPSPISCTASRGLVRPPESASLSSASHSPEPAWSRPDL